MDRGGRGVWIAGHRFAGGRGRGETRKLSGPAAGLAGLWAKTLGFAGVQRKTGHADAGAIAARRVHVRAAGSVAVLFRAEEAGLSGNWERIRIKREKRFNTEGTEKEHPSQNTLRASREHREETSGSYPFDWVAVSAVHCYYELDCRPAGGI